MTRLDKVVARRAGLSRRQAREAIQRGRVQVDGVRVRDPGLSMTGAQAILLDATALEAPPWVAALHKPVGVVSTTSDPWGRDCLTAVAGDLLDRGLHPVGRLDADTDGLLLLSRDGALTQRLLHPRHGVEKTYRATVEGAPGPELGRVLAEGVATADGVHTARLDALEGEVVTLIVTEGKHRMVRRMLANAGHPVKALRRVAFGPVVLGDLAPGSCRPVDPTEEAALRALVGAQAS